MRTIRLAGVALLGLLICASRAAAAMTPLQEVTEAMMISQGHDALSMGIAFGDALGALTFHSNVDSTSKTFTYTADAGQTYGGQAFSLTASALFDAVSGDYLVNASGSIGSRSFTRTDSLSFGAGFVNSSSNWFCPAASRDNGNAIDVGTIDTKITSQEVIFEANGQINSTCTYDAILKFQDGRTVLLGQGTGTDHLGSLAQPWSYKLRPWLINTGQPIAPVSTDSSSTGADTFSMAVTNPEPASTGIVLMVTITSALRRPFKSQR